MRVSHSIYLYTCVYICVCIYMYIYFHIHIHANTNTTSIHTQASAQSSSSCTKLLKLLQWPTPPTSGQKTRMACMLIILRECAILYPNVDCVLLSYLLSYLLSCRCHTMGVDLESVSVLPILPGCLEHKFAPANVPRKFAPCCHTRCHTLVVIPCCHTRCQPLLSYPSLCAAAAQPDLHAAIY